MHISATLILIPLAAFAAPTCTQQDIYPDPSSLLSAFTALETIDRAPLEASIASGISAAVRSALSALSAGSSNILTIRAVPTKDPEASIKGLKSDMSAVYAFLHEALASENPALRSAVDARASPWNFDVADVAGLLGARTVVAEQTAGASETPSAFGGAATVTRLPSFPEPSAAKQEFPDALLETSVSRISVAASSVSKTDDPRVVYTSSNGAVAGTALPVAAVGVGFAVLAVL